MRWEDLVFVIVLMISGEICAEEGHCDFPNVENGMLAQYYYTFKNFYFPMRLHKRLSFYCLAGYTTELGKQKAKTKCTTEGWNPAPRCIRKCSKPELNNGYISDVKVLYKIGDTMRYSCAAGYKTTGGKHVEEVRCLAHGWSSLPACRKEHETCLSPELHNGNYYTTQKTFNVKDKVLYECAAGFYTAGGKQVEEVECLPNGWALTPQCTRRRNRCPPPPVPLNSKNQSYSQTYRQGEIVRIECELHFELQGPAEMHCENGKWTEPPKCVEKKSISCEQPPSIQNGSPIQNSRAYSCGGKVEYRCETGYQLQGPKEIEYHHGQWSSPPECVKQTENCGPPPNITNGAVVGGVLASYTPGSSVEYRCNEYYLLNGSKTSHCEKGVWSSPPVCMEPCVLSEDNMTKNNIEMKWKPEGKIFHGDLIEFMCKEGYGLSPSTLPSELSVKCHRGEVKYPFCIRKGNTMVPVDH
ncbi:coagulation factor XIII B chain-like isoform X3 [Dipodomys spectabilis]|uniref:coagulation factor XIII B chain-like isoform X3 n=1 Tax=Dipodomys spectabilis TaxID=105255 RepID=UPI001C53BB27|nr:coagulation factor XIII B chain-like isoform X3 [Dipodomys spectabilis]